MKKIFALLIVAGLFAACDSKKENEEAAKALQEATRTELEQAVADRDSLLSLVNEISSGMDEIKYMENILATDGVGEEGSDRRAKIVNDIAMLQRTLEQRRLQLEKLEAQLKNSSLKNKNLLQTIETLKEQIASQSAEIDALRDNLAQANVKIEELNTAVDSLNYVVDNTVAERDAAIDRGISLENEMNICYYVAASSKELKQHKIVESGFLRKTKIMQGDFDQNFFTLADKRTLREIELYSKKAKVLSNQPADSYRIVDRGNQKVLEITNPALFWSLSNYLVIEID